MSVTPDDLVPSETLHTLGPPGLMVHVVAEAFIMCRASKNNTKSIQNLIKNLLKLQWEER